MTVHGGDSGDLSGLGAVPLLADDPRRIGPFALLGRLGSGGMGRVYLGVAGGRFAAVKQVHPHLAEDRGFVRRFGHELDNLARLPAGVSAELLDSDREARPPWLATAYISGVTLDEALRTNGGPLSVADLWLLLREAAAELAAVHEIGVVHRDLKPSNVMLRPDGATLIDFGVAQALEQSRLTQTGMAIGTPAYMSPEQAAGERELTAATDVFALGCLLGFAATGCPPYGDGGGVQMLYRIIHQDPDLGPLRAVDEDLAAVVAGCLARDPQARPTAAELNRTAVEHVTGDAVLWPEPVRQLLARHAESAKRIPEPEPAPEPAAATAVAAASEPASEPAPGRDPAGRANGKAVPPQAAAPERRKWRFPRIVVVPLVIAATGGAVALAPYVLSPKTHTPPSAEGSGTVSASAAGASAAGTSSAGAAPSTAASSTRPANSPTGHAGGAPGGKHPHGTATGTSKPTGSGSTPGGSGKTGGSAGATASGGAGGSGSSGGGSTSSGGSGTTASGTHRLKSALDGRCLIFDLNHSTAAYLAGCSSAASFKWTYAAVSGGRFELRNAASGTCLAGTGSNFTYMATCGSTTADLWKFGSSTSSGTVVESASTAGQCLQNSTTFAGDAVTTNCARSADMLWSND
ncbi:protein kinase [Streptomyces sp. NPDC020917]|uniref:serine/threonine-protein kinase n=1 Tax=Streptomyces sp. NPDC020917 TaxID=3365102 RepID=UPI0037B622B8